MSTHSTLLNDYGPRTLKSDPLSRWPLPVYPRLSLIFCSSHLRLSSVGITGSITMLLSLTWFFTCIVTDCRGYGVFYCCIMNIHKPSSLKIPVHGPESVREGTLVRSVLYTQDLPRMAVFRVRGASPKRGSCLHNSRPSFESYPPWRPVMASSDASDFSAFSFASRDSCEVFVISPFSGELARNFSIFCRLR